MNHNGDLGMALELVDMAVMAGANYIKFQTFKAENLTSASAKKASYQIRNTDNAENQLAMLQQLELSEDDHIAIMSRCEEKGISFLSTPFDMESLALLTDTFALPEIKLGSGELNNAPLLLAAGRTEAKIILSTGMGSLSEVEEALGVLAFAMCREGHPESRADFAKVLLDPSVWLVLAERVTLLHCTTEYPASVEDINLRAMETMRSAFGVRVGYSDHTLGNETAIASVAMGAKVIEKHITLGKKMIGPDHAASMEPREFYKFVKSIRKTEELLGSEKKEPSINEIKVKKNIRKSIVAKYEIKKGELLCEKNIISKRPEGGISSLYWNKVIGKKAKYNFKKDDFIKF